MAKKVSDLKQHKRKKGKLSLEDSARQASLRFLSVDYEAIEEPRGLASGKTTEAGSFIREKGASYDD